MTFRPLACLACLLTLAFGLHPNLVWSQVGEARDGLRMLPVTAASEVPPRSGRWWPMPVVILNTSDQDRVALVAASLKGRGQSAFSLKLEVPADSTIADKVWVKLPDVPAASTIQVNVTFNEIIDGQPVLLESDDARSVQDLDLILGDSPVIAAAITNVAGHPSQTWEWRRDTRNHPYELIIACRESDRLNTAVSEMPSLPENIRAWDALDNVFVNDPSGLNNPAGVAAFRQWLVEGGHAWIALDRVSPELLQPLLGDVWQAKSIGKIQLTSFDIRTKLRPDMATRPQRVERYQPVNVLRVEQTGGEVTHRINEWPAAIRVRIGKGEVWLTTVDASAWYEEPVLDPEATFRPAYVPNNWAIPIVSSFQQPRESEPVEFVSTQQAASHVGYPVPSRAAVFGSLGFFTIATLIAGAVLWRRGRLEWTGWAVPAIALLAATPLFASARSSRSNVVDTLAHVQFADVQPGNGQAIIEQRTAVYLSEPRPLRFNVPTDTTLEPFIDTSTVAPFRWEDQPDGSTTVDFPNWPTGLQPVHATFASSTDAAEAIGKFSENGLEIEIPASIPAGLKDPIFVWPPSRADVMSPKTGSSNVFVVGADVPTVSELRLGTGMLDKTQRHHQDVYRSLFDPQSTESMIRSTSILVWSEPWSSPLDGVAGAIVKGEALSRINVRFMPSTPGTKVKIPSNTIAAVSTESNVADTTSGRIANGQPHDPLDTPRDFQFRWQLPAQVLPLQVESAKFAIEINAPQRVVRISATTEREDAPVKLLGEYTNQNGVVVLDVDPADLMVDSNIGSVLLNIQISDEIVDEALEEEEEGLPTDAPIVLAPEDKTTWQISRPQWTFTGTVMPPG